MNFKPTKWKVIVAILIIILVYLANFYLSFNGCNIGCPDNNGISSFPPKYLSIYPSCSCDYFYFNSFILSLLILIIPSILLYLVWSLIEKKK